MRLSRREFGLTLAAAGAAPALGQAQPQTLTAFLDAEYARLNAMSPETLTRQGGKQRYGELNDRSDEAAAAQLAFRRKSVADMKARFDPAKLGEEDRTSFEMWAGELERAEINQKWRGHRYVFGYSADHAGLPRFMITTHRVDTVADMEAYIARVHAIGVAMDQQLTQATNAAARGVRMPRFAYDQSLDEVKRVTTGAPFGGEGDSALFADAKAKIAGLRTKGLVTPAQAEALTHRVSDAMTDRMKPAYERLSAWLTADRAKASPEAQGVGALPNGAAYYNDLLRLQTTTDMTADEIHALGLAEVARVRQEMEVLKAKIGFAGDLQAFFEFMRTDDRFFVPNDDAGRARYLAVADGYLKDIAPKLPAYFATLPKAPLEVRRVEAFREEPGGAAHYNAGARDGSRPGIYYVHLADTRATPIFEIEGTTYHEGLPGHHMQISIAQELTGLPKCRTAGSGYGAYVEGWGLYSEGLAKEMGQYTDLYSDFGRLGRDIWRGIRLVVDTGIHAKGWSEKQAYDYYTSNSPQPAAKIRSEIRRYFVNPGQACSYKVGEVAIRDLRDRARSTLGAHFSYPGFHDAVLRGGAMPLSVLKQRVDRWMATQRA